MFCYFLLPFVTVLFVVAIVVLVVVVVVVVVVSVVVVVGVFLELSKQLHTGGAKTQR